MADLISRLRIPHRTLDPILNEAADEIVRLRAEIDRLNGMIDRMCASHRPPRKDGE